MAKSKVVEAEISAEHVRIDGGTDMLVKCTLMDSQIKWMAYRSTSDSACVVHQHIKRDQGRRGTCLNTKPGPVPVESIERKRTFLSTTRTALTTAKYAFKAEYSDAFADFLLLKGDDEYARQHIVNLKRAWRIHELIWPKEKGHDGGRFLVRLSCTRSDSYSFATTQFVLEAVRFGQIGLRSLDPRGYSPEPEYDKKIIEGISDALLNDNQRILSMLLVDLERGIENARDAQIVFDRRRKELGDGFTYLDLQRPNSVRQKGGDLEARLEVVHSYDGRLAQAFLMKNDEFWFVLLVSQNVFGKEKMAKITGGNGHYKEVVFTTPIETARRLLGLASSEKTEAEARIELQKTVDRDFQRLLTEHSSRALITICEIAELEGGGAAAFYSVLPSTPMSLPASCPRPIYRIKVLQPKNSKDGTKKIYSLTTLPSGKDSSAFNGKAPSDFLTFLRDAITPSRYSEAIKYLQDNVFHDDPGYHHLDDACSAWSALTAGGKSTQVDGLVCPVGAPVLERLGQMAVDRELNKIRQGVEDGYWEEGYLKEVIAKLDKLKSLPPEINECIKSHTKQHARNVGNNLPILTATKKRGRPPKTWESDEAKAIARREAKAQWAREARGAGKLKEPKERVAARQAQWRKRNADRDE
ncbi:hypothetical protein [Pseudomonas sp. PDM25]|uniref:hypothetical protein n=1 Tax=Pseudomonas sp. PDM25 TaxID=2854772 RepID=UPI001C474B00|nr:hypothetical protein [Pseudomonas sp. PDM25]MBV7514499.1 hypothetical protein [Pseudomonas sp. PDM25]